MNNIMKIYPSADDLSVVKSHIRCTIDGCQSIFTSESNLTLHLAKTHRREPLSKSDDVNKEYYCPEPTCTYNETKFFKTLKLLKQHFLKVHVEKSFVCDKCGKGFPTINAKNSHVDYCSAVFKCCDCDLSYSSYESLLTHGRRKNHHVKEKTAFKALQGDGRNLSPRPSSITDVKIRKGAFLLPNCATTLHILNLVPLQIYSDKFSQTDICTELPTLKTKHTQVYKEKVPKNHSSKHSQTQQVIKTRLSAETQTTGDYIAKKPRLSNVASVLLQCGGKTSLSKSIKTQTKPVTSKTKSCNTSFEMNEADYVSDIRKNSSGTQTTIPVSNELLYSTSTATHDSIHTDTSDLDFDFMNSSSQTSLNLGLSLFDPSNFFNFNIETQTDSIFDGNDLLDYNNIQTQTTDMSPDIHEVMMDSRNDVLFSTIHTQTMVDDRARSVESQTMMSHNRVPLLTCHDMAHMETQTDIDFKKLLEEINA